VCSIHHAPRPRSLVDREPLLQVGGHSGQLAGCFRAFPARRMPSRKSADPFSNAKLKGLVSAKKQNFTALTARSGCSHLLP